MTGTTMLELEAELRRVKRERDQYAYAYNYTLDEIEKFKARLEMLQVRYRQLLDEIVAGELVQS